jgi:hypothetical protein
MNYETGISMDQDHASIEGDPLDIVQAEEKRSRRKWMIGIIAFRARRCHRVADARFWREQLLPPTNLTKPRHGHFAWPRDYRG